MNKFIELYKIQFSFLRRKKIPILESCIPPLPLIKTQILSYAFKLCPQSVPNTFPLDNNSCNSEGTQKCSVIFFFISVSDGEECTLTTVIFPLKYTYIGISSSDGFGEIMMHRSSGIQ